MVVELEDVSVTSVVGEDVGELAMPEEELDLITEEDATDEDREAEEDTALDELLIAGLAFSIGAWTAG